MIRKKRFEQAKDWPLARDCWHSFTVASSSSSSIHWLFSSSSSSVDLSADASRLVHSVKSMRVKKWRWWLIDADFLCERCCVSERSSDWHPSDFRLMMFVRSLEDIDRRRRDVRCSLVLFSFARNISGEKRQREREEKSIFLTTNNRRQKEKRIDVSLSSFSNSTSVHSADDDYNLLLIFIVASTIGNNFLLLLLFSLLAHSRPYIFPTRRLTSESAQNPTERTNERTTDRHRLGFKLDISQSSSSLRIRFDISFEDVKQHIRSMIMLPLLIFISNV